MHRCTQGKNEYERGINELIKNVATFFSILQHKFRLEYLEFEVLHERDFGTGAF